MLKAYDVEDDLIKQLLKQVSGNSCDNETS